MAQSLFERFEAELAGLKSDGLYRVFRPIRHIEGNTVVFEDGSQKTLFCSNNYLNLADDPRVVQAAYQAGLRYGVGSGSARLIAGTYAIHRHLEECIAGWFKKPAALLLPSGWTANHALLATLPQKDDLVLMDRFDHASIIDAVQHSPATFRTYRRDQLDRLEKFLADSRFAHKFIVTESIFSMDGDAADLQTLVNLKNRYGAVLIVDEAHSVGCFGKTGAGWAEELNVLEQVDIFVIPLGKAVGAAGGVIAADRAVIDYLVNKARAFIFTTSVSPMVAGGAVKAIEIIQSEPHRRRQLAVNAARLRQQLAAAGCHIGASISQIVPVIVGSAQTALDLAQTIFQAGFYAPAIRPPTVPQNTARLRLSVQSAHTNPQIDGVAHAITNFLAKHKPPQ